MGNFGLEKEIKSQIEASEVDCHPGTKLGAQQGKTLLSQFSLFLVCCYDVKK